MFNNDFLRPMREQLAYTRKRISVAQNIIPPYIQKIRENYSQMHNQIVSPFVQEIRNTFQKIAQGIQETEEDVKVYKTVMMKCGYPPNGSMSIPSLKSIAEDYRNNDIEDIQEHIDKFMIEYYDEPTLQKISSIWEDNNQVTKRISLLRNLVKAHNLKMFELVVPSAISQLEGIIVDAFGIKGKVDSAILKILLKYLFEENNQSKSEYNFDPIIYTYYIERVLVSFEHGIELKSDISRHAILHGGDTEFGKETVSLKVILLLDYLLDSITELRDEVKISAKQEVKRYRKLQARNRNKNHVRKKSS